MPTHLGLQALSPFHLPTIIARKARELTNQHVQAMSYVIEHVPTVGASHCLDLCEPGKGSNPLLADPVELSAIDSDTFLEVDAPLTGLLDDDVCVPKEYTHVVGTVSKRTA